MMRFTLYDHSLQSLTDVHDNMRVVDEVAIVNGVRTPSVVPSVVEPKTVARNYVWSPVRSRACHPINGGFLEFLANVIPVKRLTR